VEVPAEHCDDVRSFDHASQGVPVLEARLTHPRHGVDVERRVVERHDRPRWRRVLEHVAHGFQLRGADDAVRVPGDKTVQRHDAEATGLAHRSPFAGESVERFADVVPAGGEVSCAECLGELGPAVVVAGRVNVWDVPLGGELADLVPDQRAALRRAIVCNVTGDDDEVKVLEALAIVQDAFERGEASTPVLSKPDAVT
jgi:hypothetical protein